MPDRQFSSTSQSSAAAAAAALTTISSVQKLKEHAPKTTQRRSFSTVLTISACGILLFLIAATILGPIILPLLILISNHIWIPLGVLVFIAATGFLSFLGFAVATAAALSWLYRYFRGFRYTPGSTRFDYAATRVADVASHAEDYNRVGR